MIDLKELRANPKAFERSAELRGIKVDIPMILKLDHERLELIPKVDELRSKLKFEGKPDAATLKKLQTTKDELSKLEVKLKQVDDGLSEALSDVPNLLAPDTPEGGEEHNREERTWGEALKRDLRDHVELAEANGWLDFERATKVAGAKFYYTKGAAVLLEMAVMRYALDKLSDAGFTAMTVPHLVNERTIKGTGFMPRGDEKQIYKVEDEDLYLIATSEIPLTGYHADEILSKDELPKLYVGFSPSYRVEAGAYGKHSKGLYRVHQFDKLEMYVFCDPEDSAEWHERLVKLEEEMCRDLEIPYRVVRIAAGDLGAPAYSKYDIEYWSPVDGAYRELMSCSNVTDFQARRMNVRFKGADGNRFVHTLNGTALAFSRIFIALVENHQTDSGSVRLPQALRPYYGGEEL